MNVLENYSLKNLNTFGFECIAKYYVAVSSVGELLEVLRNPRFSREKVFILGGGSNVLFTKDFDGLVVHIKIGGIKVLEETDEKVTFKVGAGENWDKFVRFTIKRGYSGLENLSLIPGTVGASVVQNIGAYGREVKDFVSNVYVLDTKSLNISKYKNSECNFGYRTSIFKTKLKDDIITHVSFGLYKNRQTFLIEYPGIKERLVGKDINAKTIRNAVISIRNEKLPDPSILGNAGSFFKNVEMKKNELLTLQKKFSELKNVPIYPSSVGVKIPTAWLIERCGYKGKGRREGKQVGSFEKQALILVNYGRGTGIQLKELADEIRQTIHEKFGIAITPEVVIL